VKRRGNDDKKNNNIKRTTFTLIDDKIFRKKTPELNKNKYLATIYFNEVKKKERKKNRRKINFSLSRVFLLFIFFLVSEKYPNILEWNFGLCFFFIIRALQKNNNYKIKSKKKMWTLFLLIKNPKHTLLFCFCFVLLSSVPNIFVPTKRKKRKTKSDLCDKIKNG